MKIVETFTGVVENVKTIEGWVEITLKFISRLAAAKCVRVFSLLTKRVATLSKLNKYFASFATSAHLSV